MTAESTSNGNRAGALSDQPAHARCFLASIELPEALAERLMEQGFVPGTAITVARSAPSGDPRVYRVDGVEIALRRETAAGLLVRPVAGEGES